MGPDIVRRFGSARRLRALASLLLVVPLFACAGERLDAPEHEPPQATDDAFAAASEAPAPSDSPPPSPVDDFSLGPYPSARDILLRSLRANAARLDTSKSYTDSAAQGYIL